mmetsp:Transcript_13935/g.39333  ORF Transcript_13935/g.39333 Transcript_13935/m.39333 type:complete len:216 (-) Transcript_13935:412-1059(-)
MDEILVSNSEALEHLDDGFLFLLVVLDDLAVLRSSQFFPDEEPPVGGLRESAHNDHGDHQSVDQNVRQSHLVHVIDFAAAHDVRAVFVRAELRAKKKSQDKSRHSICRAGASVSRRAQNELTSSQNGEKRVNSIPLFTMSFMLCQYPRTVGMITLKLRMAKNIISPTRKVGRLMNKSEISGGKSKKMSFKIHPCFPYKKDHRLPSMANSTDMMTT